MTTHELAKLLLQQADVTLFIDDQPIDAPILEPVVTDDGPAVILWTKE